MVDDTEIATLKEKIIVLNANHEVMTKAIHSIQSGDSKIFKLTTIFLGLTTAIIGLFGAATYKINTDQVKETVADAKSKINELTGRTSIDGATTRGQLKDDTITAIISYAPEVESASGLISYNIVLEIPFLIDATGNGIGQFIGSAIKLDGDIVSVFSSNVDSNTIIKESADRYRRGLKAYLNSPQVMVSGLPYLYTHEINIHKLTCADAMNVVAKLLSKDSHSTIKITPVFVNIKNAPIEKSFNVEIYDNTLWQCSYISQHLTQYKNSKNKN